MSQGFEHQQSHIQNLILQHTCWIFWWLPTEKITEANRYSCPEEWIPCKWKCSIVHITVRTARISHFTLKNDCHDDSVNSHCLTENNTECMYKYLTKFFDLILGALTAAPRMLAPAMKIPLNDTIDTKLLQQRWLQVRFRCQHMPNCKVRYCRKLLPNLNIHSYQLLIKILITTYSNT